MINTPLDPTPISLSSLNTQHYDGHLFLPAVLWYFLKTGEKWPLPVVRVIPDPSITMLIRVSSSRKKKKTHTCNFMPTKTKKASLLLYSNCRHYIHHPEFPKFSIYRYLSTSPITCISEEIIWYFIWYDMIYLTATG